jgi:hypothetical protein
MDIPLVSPAPLGAAASVSPIAAVQALAVAEADNAATLAASLTTVDLSPLGQFLSATSLLQKKILELQIAAGSATPKTVPDAAAIAASAATLAQTFNELRASNIGATDVGTGTADGQSLASQFAQQFGAHTVPAADGGAAALPDLAAVGLNFAPAAPEAQHQVLSVDQPVLQAALESDPAGAGALLGQAAAALRAVSGAAPEAEPAAQHIAVAPQPAAVPVSETAPTHDDAFLQALLNESPRAATAPEAAQVFRSEAQFLTLPAEAATPATNGALAAATPAAAPAGNPLAIDPAVEAQVNRVLSDQAEAARSAAGAADARALSASEQERAALAAADDKHNAALADAIRIDNKAAQVRREQQAIAPATPVAAPEAPDAAERLAATVLARPAASTEDAVDTAAPTPLPAAPDPALQAARDPAIAAAIAAYNLNSGPFSALNGRPEAGAPKVKIVAPVATVTKVAPIDTDSNLQGGTREFR